MAPVSKAEDLASLTASADARHVSTNIDHSSTASRAGTTATAPNPNNRAPHEAGVLQEATGRNGTSSQNQAPKNRSNTLAMQTGPTLSREEAARLTSELTVAAAKEFNQSAYYSTIRKQRLKWTQTIARTQAPSVENAARTQPVVRQKRTTHLTPSETKFEQARLLTLLRSLHPDVVVNQIYKAVAYFGGIPMGPLPSDYSAFPDSDTGYGSGSNFIGWLSEIFPITTPPGTEITAVDETALPPRKRRGRPKGSKSTKVRSDKGGRHVTKKSRCSAPDAGEDDGPDHVQSGNSGGLFQEATSNIEPSLDETANQPNDAATAAPRPAKRGRPKGSKSRPKNSIDSQNPASTDMEEAVAASTLMGEAASALAMANLSNSLRNSELTAQEQLTTHSLAEQSIDMAAPQPALTTDQASSQQPIQRRTSSRKRKLQESVADTGDLDESEQTTSPSSRTPEMAHCRNASDTGAGGQVPPLSSSDFDTQNQAVDVSAEGTSNYSQTQLPQYFIAASGQQQSRAGFSPVMNQAHQGSPPNSLTAGNIHRARPKYMQQQQQQQQKHQNPQQHARQHAMLHQSQELVFGSSTNDGMSHNMVSRNTVQPSHYLLGTSSASPSAGMQAAGKKANEYRHLQSGGSSSNSGHMASYSAFGSQGFMP
ncbi:hypothetical protein E4U17_001862 [Claviceps sp. LM77 group G4]|nr:hypothetical protein E4U17_001862 [Claviceps sp. LM77 group G4]KAG6077265.1 hypothetical protein E4U16_002338 [Claviceps sp. LM84 group G4]